MLQNRTFSNANLSCFANIYILLCCCICCYWISVFYCFLSNLCFDLLRIHWAYKHTFNYTALKTQTITHAHYAHPHTSTQSLLHYAQFELTFYINIAVYTLMRSLNLTHKQATFCIGMLPYIRISHNWRHYITKLPVCYLFTSLGIFNVMSIYDEIVFIVSFYCFVTTLRCCKDNEGVPTGRNYPSIYLYTLGTFLSKKIVTFRLSAYYQSLMRSPYHILIIRSQ